MSNEASSSGSKSQPEPKKPQKQRYRCKECSKRFETKGGLAIHVKVHSPECLLQCPECEFSSYQRGNFAKHMANIHRKDLDGQYLYEEFSCTSCTEKFVTEAKLKVHVLRKHTPTTEKEHKCKYCGYASIEKADLQKHVRIRHTEERPFHCEFCTFRSHTASGLARHRRSHTATKPFQCHLCYMSYADKKRLNVHLMKHSNEKPFSCPSCKYSTNRNDNLKLHIRRNHMDTATESFSYQMPEPVRIEAIENPFLAPDFQDFLDMELDNINNITVHSSAKEFNLGLNLSLGLDLT